MDIEEKLRAAQILKQEVLADIQAFCDKLPDNPNIRRLPGSPSAFVLSSRNLSSDLVLSPFYYDHKRQFSKIAELVQLAVRTGGTSAMQDLLMHGKDKEGNRYAPEVIEQVKPLLEKLIAVL